MRLGYDRTNKDLACFINNNTRDVKICINDISRLHRYMTKINDGNIKEYQKKDTSTGYLRIYINENGKPIELKMYVEKILYGELELYDSDRDYIISLKTNDNEEYINIFVKHYIDRREFSNQSELENTNLYICDCKYDDDNYKYSSQNHLIYDTSKELEKYNSKSNRIDEFLNNWKSYYEVQLEYIDEEKDTVVSELLLDEYRNNYDFWESISSDTEIFIPVRVQEFGTRLRSTSLIIKTSSGREEDLLRDYTNVKYRLLSKIKDVDFFDSAIENFDYSIKCDVARISNDEGMKISYNKLIDRNTIETYVKRNLAGERTRIKRIIEGIDLVISSNVANDSLIDQMVNNKLVDKHDYKSNINRINELRKNYLLNDEQALIVDKVLNMDDLFLVQGPPGTGKTTIISTIVKELDKQNKKVLLTSNVREARLNIIERIKGEKELIIKEYTNLKSSDDKHKFELFSNKKRYIQNQIIEKFTFDNILICNENEYNNILIKRENYSKSLEYIENLIEEKNNYNTYKLREENKLNIANKVLNNILKDQVKNIYSLIVNDDLEKIGNDILYDYLSQFIAYYNEGKLPNLVEVINNQKVLKKQLKQCLTIDSKLKLYKKIKKNMLTVNVNIFDNDIIDNYLSASRMKKIMFKFSNRIKLFCINGYSYNLLNEYVSKCDSVINNMNYNIINDDFKILIDKFSNYINNQIQIIGNNINNYENMINAKNIEIEDEKNKNYNTQEKLEEINKFIDSYNSIKKLYPNVDVFYDYLTELNEIVDESTDKEFVDQMLSGNYLNTIFEYYSSDGGNILSMSTNQVAKYFETSEEIFDYIIVDEASKCNFNDLIISLSRTKKLVLIGDYLQLDPVPEEKEAEFISDNEWSQIQLSNFSQLIKPVVEENFNRDVDYNQSSSIGILKKQYRMSKEIFEIISKIYESIDGFEIMNDKKVNPYHNYHNVLTLQCDGIESQRTEDETSRSNEAEVNYICDIMKYLVELSNNNEVDRIKKIGIISFYRLQSQHISNRISKSNYKNKLQKNGIDVQIGTVDNFQGREFDLVIVSCVRTELTKPFLTEIRRWNVSISRAKDKLIIIGNFKELYENSKIRKVNPNSNQSEKELSVIYNDIIPYLNDKSEKFSNIEEIVKDFVRKGNE